MSTWESILATLAFGLGNGGPGGLIYTYIAVYIGFILVIVSMAEMASMAPTSGMFSRLGACHQKVIDIFATRWPISLGLGICSSRCPTVAVIFHRMDGYSRVPGRNDHRRIRRRHSDPGYCHFELSGHVQPSPMARNLDGHGHHNLGGILQHFLCHSPPVG